MTLKEHLYILEIFVDEVKRDEVIMPRKNAMRDSVNAVRSRLPHLSDLSREKIELALLYYESNVDETVAAFERGKCRTEKSHVYEHLSVVFRWSGGGLKRLE